MAVCRLRGRLGFLIGTDKDGLCGRCSAAAPARRRDARVELLRVIGALSVFLYHFMGDVETVLRPALVHAAPWAVVRQYSGLFGVSLFITISGLVFTWAWPRAASSVEFVRRRLAAIFPLYWWIAVPLIAGALLAHRMPTTDLWKVPVWLSGLGVLSPATFFPVVDAWWYMSLALQLVLIYPVLRRMQERLGVEVFVLVSAGVTIGSVYGLRSLGLGYAIQGFAGCRLLEFALGMTFGVCLSAGTRGWPKISAFTAMLVAAGACVAASPGDLTRIALASALVVLLTVGLAPDFSGRFGRWATFGGGLSFAFYLCHSPWAKPILASVAGLGSPTTQVVLGAAMSLTAAGLIAWGFRGSFTWASRRLRVRSPRAEE